MDRPKLFLCDFPTPARLFCTAFFILLGVGVLVSECKVLLKYRLADGKPLLTPRDLVLSYYGDPGVPLIEQKLRTVPTPDHKEFQKKSYEKQIDYLIEWTRKGASEKEDDFAPVVETIENHCVNCHDVEGAASSSPFWMDRVVRHDLVAPLFAKKGGAVSATRLVHLTHVHLLTNVMIFVLTGAVVLFCRMRGGIKSVLVLLPFVGIVLDIGSWWLTAFVSPVFAYTLMLGGALMGVSFLVQFLAVMHGLWLQRAIEEST